MHKDSSGEANQPQRLNIESVRHSWYREMGWWQGERLEARYERTVIDRPHDLAVIDNRGRKLTHQQLWQQADNLATRLSRHGIEAGERVLVYVPNWAEWQIAFLALLQLNAVPAPIPITTDAGTLAYAAELTQARLLIAGDTHGKQDLAAVASSAVSQSERGLDLMLLSAQGDFSWAGDSNASPAPARAIPQLDHVMFTSSTTGRPKAVMHTTDTLAALNQTFSQRFSLGPDQPIFMASPLGHSVGAYHGARLALFTGAPLVLQDRWQPEAALALIEQYQCAFTVAATPFLRDLVQAPWQGAVPKLAPLRSFLCGGAPVPPVLLEQAGHQFPNTFVTNLWGMTEGGLVTCVRESPKEKIISTAGIGLPGLELRILDSDCNVKPAGEEGELAMRGPGVFFGYLGQDELYNSLMTADGFFRTEDLARIDGAGYVQITGRLKDLIIRGGVNISPIPIEDVLARHPNVESVAVIGTPDERLGERICAVILPKGDQSNLDDLVTFAVESGLPKRYCPEILHYVTEMPRTAGGKIRKADLKRIIQENEPDFLAS
ncbi:MAG: AMP-binding protein [Pseudomonadales bacterium]